MSNEYSERIRKEEKKRNTSYFDEDNEETFVYDERKTMQFINSQKGGVFDTKMQKGINTAESVFERDALFKTR
ncbi:MAG: hypothetical protein J6O61_10560 [Butyrivibrio sp.]|uniref:hypothetical protein n=1 Tax=Butyrivibrio sp. TaxID=28121 RepID=UPI001B1D686C|nr:hypothetical protein [Butyrivibrio sp.]MBO6241251.1 hypothetical protein [Butyrivibrio sp.]